MAATILVLLAIIATGLCVIAWRLIAGKDAFNNFWSASFGRLTQSTTTTKICLSLALIWPVFVFLVADHRHNRFGYDWQFAGLGWDHTEIAFVVILPILICVLLSLVLSPIKRWMVKHRPVLVGGGLLILLFGTVAYIIINEQYYGSDWGDSWSINRDAEKIRWWAKVPAEERQQAEREFRACIKASRWPELFGRDRVVSYGNYKRCWENVEYSDEIDAFYEQGGGE